MTSKEPKEQYEIAIGDQFLDALPCERRFMGHGKDAGEPDLIYAIAGRHHSAPAGTRGPVVVR